MLRVLSEEISLLMFLGVFIWRNSFKTSLQWYRGLKNLLPFFGQGPSYQLATSTPGTGETEPLTGPYRVVRYGVSALGLLVKPLLGEAGVWPCRPLVFQPVKWVIR